MNKYNLFVDGKEILKQVPYEELENNLATLRGLVWTSGGSDKNIRITQNNLKDCLDCSIIDSSRS